MPPSIRDVIAFPKTAKGTELMTDSPAAVTSRQLRDLHIEVKVAKNGIRSFAAMMASLMWCRAYGSILSAHRADTTARVRALHNLLSVRQRRFWDKITRFCLSADKRGGLSGY
jgi:hypothetical protein